MLWYKAWLETRSRFLVGLVGTVVLCSWFVLYEERGALSFMKGDRSYRGLHSGHIFLVMFWVLSVTVLMMGGLLREKTAGSSAFTLALPVRRTRLMAVRIAVGLMEAVALAVLPWIAMASIGTYFGKTHAFSQALFYLVFLLGGGLIFFSTSVLVSSLVEGESMAQLVSVGLVMAAIVLDKPIWRQYNPLLFMMADGHGGVVGLLKGPVPWLEAGAFALLAALLLGVSVKAIRRREF
jgi:ABC-type transport system involved in multi-copper enzyme maturation permease subunit